VPLLFVLASLFLRAIGPPVAPAARVLPCSVELVHVEAVYGAEDRIRWVTHRTAVHRLVRRWEDARAYRDWEHDPIAPIALTRTQARAIQGAVTTAGRVLLLLEDSALNYAFDAAGRTREVAYAAGADKGTYRFRYRYRCERPSRIAWVD
jgi:hypothetical protein